jgi:hypothetical protein
VTHQPDADTEVQRLLKPLSTKWVEAVCGVTRETVATWRSGASQPRPDRWLKLVKAVRAILPEKEEEAPAEAGAAEELLRRWLGNDPPPWAQGLTDQIVSAIEGDRQAVVSAAIEAAVDVAERRLFEDSGPEAETPPTDPPPATGGGRPRPEA